VNSPFSIARLQHIGLPVTNLDVSSAFYEGLGFVEVMKSTFDHSGGIGKVSMLKQGDIVLELYQMPEPELEQIRQRKDGRIDHIAFDVEDIEATFATLSSAGYTIVEPEPVFLPFWKQGCRYFNILGPDGERLEFNQIL
jgi:lactoylglutathione lyase